MRLNYFWNYTYYKATRYDREPSDGGCEHILKDTRNTFDSRYNVKPFNPSTIFHHESVPSQPRTRMWYTPTCRGAFLQHRRLEVARMQVLQRCPRRYRHLALVNLGVPIRVGCIARVHNVHSLVGEPRPCVGRIFLLRCNLCCDPLCRRVDSLPVFMSLESRVG